MMFDANFSGNIDLTKYTPDPYGIVAGYNQYYGSVQMFEEIERYFIYTFGNESWYIDGYQLAAHTARNNTPVSNMHRRHLDNMYCGLKIRMDCHEFVEDKLRNVRY